MPAEKERISPIAPSAIPYPSAGQGIRKKAGITWDEDNIVQTSADRGTRQKITEPKTPYIYGIAADTDDEHLPRLDVAAEASATQPLGDGAMEWNSQDLMGSNNKTVMTIAENAEQVRGKLESYRITQQSKPIASTEPEEWQTSCSEYEEVDDSEQNSVFERKRMEHYKMKEALSLGKRLLSQDVDLEEEEDDETDDDDNNISTKDSSDYEVEKASPVGQSDIGYVEEDDDDEETPTQSQNKNRLNRIITKPNHLKNKNIIPYLKQQQQQLTTSDSPSADADDERSPQTLSTLHSAQRYK